MSTRYDPTIIQTFADRLYKQADQIIYSYGLFGFMLGIAAGAAIGMSTGSHDTPVVPALLGGALFCALFVSAARARAFALRLQAQTALCQAQIERNTKEGA